MPYTVSKIVLRDPMGDVFFMDATLRYRYTFPERGLYLEPYIFFRNLFDNYAETIKDYPMPGFNILAGLKVQV